MPWVLYMTTLWTHFVSSNGCENSKKTKRIKRIRTYICESSYDHTFSIRFGLFNNNCHDKFLINYASLSHTPNWKHNNPFFIRLLFPFGIRSLNNTHFLKRVNTFIKCILNFPTYHCVYACSQISSIVILFCFESIHKAQIFWHNRRAVPFHT